MITSYSQSSPIQRKLFYIHQKQNNNAQTNWRTQMWGNTTINFIRTSCKGERKPTYICFLWLNKWDVWDVWTIVIFFLELLWRKLFFPVSYYVSLLSRNDKKLLAQWWTIMTKGKEKYNTEFWQQMWLW
jgi:hypothetical protein